MRYAYYTPRLVDRSEYGDTMPSKGYRSASSRVRTGGAITGLPYEGTAFNHSAIDAYTYSILKERLRKSCPSIVIKKYIS